MSNSHFVYIMAHRGVDGPELPVKIGISKNPASRLASVQTGNWRKLELVHVFWFPTRDLALCAEREFHLVACESAMCGEWFYMEPFAALRLLCQVVGAIAEQVCESEDVSERILSEKRYLQAKNWMDRSRETLQ